MADKLIVPDHITSAAFRANDLLGNTEYGRGLLQANEEMLNVFEGDALSNIDRLTGLLNQKGLIGEFSFLKSTLERQNLENEFKYTVVVCDLIGLKKLNEKHGHSGADEILKNAAKHLKKSCRESDLVARWGGGDEFVMVLINADDIKTQEILDKLKSSLPDEVDFNMCFKTFDQFTHFEDNLDYVTNKLEEFKKARPTDANGRVTGAGVVVQLD